MATVIMRRTWHIVHVASLKTRPVDGIMIAILFGFKMANIWFIDVTGWQQNKHSARCFARLV